jgi:hypothetical protein
MNQYPKKYLCAKFGAFIPICTIFPLAAGLYVPSSIIFVIHTTTAQGQPEYEQNIIFYLSNISRGLERKQDSLTINMLWYPDLFCQNPRPFSNYLPLAYPSEHTPRIPLKARLLLRRKHHSDSTLSCCFGWGTIHKSWRVPQSEQCAEEARRVIPYSDEKFMWKLY